MCHHIFPLLPGCLINHVNKYNKHVLSDSVLLWIFEVHHVFWHPEVGPGKLDIRHMSHCGFHQVRSSISFPASQRSVMALGNIGISDVTAFGQLSILKKINRSFTP